jgi:hypothetical protein
MSSPKRYLLMALNFAISLTAIATFAPRAAHAVAELMVHVVNTPANPIPTNNVGGGSATQVGQVPSRLVDLICDPGCGQILPDGSTVGSSYSIPSDQVLVITDVQWDRVNVGFAQGNYVPFSVLVNGSTVAGFWALVDGNQIAAGQAHLATGVVVPSGSVLKVTGTATMQGYLVPNQ